MSYVAIPIPEIKLPSILRATGIVTNPGFTSMFPCTNENVFKEYLRTNSSQLPNIVDVLSKSTNLEWVGSPRDTAFFYSTESASDFALSCGNSSTHAFTSMDKATMVSDIFVRLGKERVGYSGFHDGLLTRYTTALLIAELPSSILEGSSRDRLAFLDLNWVTDVFVCPQSVCLSSYPHPWLSLKSEGAVWASESGKFIQTLDTNVKLMIARAYVNQKFKEFTTSDVQRPLGTLEVLLQRYS